MRGGGYVVWDEVRGGGSGVGLGERWGEVVWDEVRGGGEVVSE